MRYKTRSTLRARHTIIHIVVMNDSVHIFTETFDLNREFLFLDSYIRLLRQKLFLFLDLRVINISIFVTMKVVWRKKSTSRRSKFEFTLIFSDLISQSPHCNTVSSLFGMNAAMEKSDE